jgi:hypothetical protein
MSGIGGFETEPILRVIPLRDALRYGLTVRTIIARIEEVEGYRLRSGGVIPRSASTRLRFGLYGMKKSQSSAFALVLLLDNVAGGRGDL